MRYRALEKFAIIHTVEDGALGITRTLQQLGNPKETLYNWCDRYLTGDLEALAYRTPPPSTS